jgi:O-antigen/teichoic acid export membrane protein
LKKSYSFLIKELIYFGIYLTILIFFNSEQLLQILYKDKYLSGSSSLAILSLTIPLFFGSNVMGNLLISIGKEKIQIFSMVISTTLKVFLLIFFVHEYGILGAAISCLIADAISFLILYNGVRINEYKIVIIKSDITDIFLISTAVLTGIILKNIFLHAIIIFIALLYHSRNNLKLVIATIKDNKT